MNTIVRRLLVFFIGIPAVIALVFSLQGFRYNLLLNIVVVIFCGLGAIELSAMLAKRNLIISKIEAFILGILAPTAALLTVSFNAPERFIIPIMLMAGAGWILLSRVFSKAEKIENAAGNIAAGFTVLVYPGFFLYWVIMMTGWENTWLLLLFLFITFGYDSAAWLFGTLFGKNNRGVIPASPNKSVAGFMGGIIGSMIVASAAALIFPHIFPVCLECVGIWSLVRMVLLLGLFTGIAAALGDLAESAIKRSCGVKDSGTLMFARGGVLDSIDSVAAAAPVFYFLVIFLFNL